MPYVMVDIESDGPIPGEYSMICFGAVIVGPGLERTFYGQIKPISQNFVPEALSDVAVAVVVSAAVIGKIADERSSNFGWNRLAQFWYT